MAFRCLKGSEYASDIKQPALIAEMTWRLWEKKGPRPAAEGLINVIGSDTVNNNSWKMNSPSHYLISRILESLAHVLLISIEFSFHFGFLWYSRFFKRLFRPVKIFLPGHSLNNYQVWLYKLNLMCEELSYQIMNTSGYLNGFGVGMILL